MTNKERLKLALEALRRIKSYGNTFAYRTTEQNPHEQVCEAIKALEEALAKQEQGEPVVFKIYKPTPPRHAIPNVRDAELPWVYDQDPSSGNVASMWVTPVKTTLQQRKPLTHEQRFDLLTQFEPQKNKWEAPAILIDMVEAAHGIKE